MKSARDFVNALTLTVSARQNAMLTSTGSALGNRSQIALALSGTFASLPASALGSWRQSSVTSIPIFPRSATSRKSGLSCGSSLPAGNIGDTRRDSCTYCFFVRFLRFGQIAGEIGITENTVKVHRSRDQDLLDAIQIALERDRARLQREAEIAVLRERFESLTLREREGVAMVVSGMPNKRSAQYPAELPGRAESWLENLSKCFCFPPRPRALQPPILGQACPPPADRRQMSPCQKRLQTPTPVGDRVYDP